MESIPEVLRPEPLAPAAKPAPTHPLLELLDQQPNSIGFIRLLCAYVVILAHSFACGEFGVEPLARLTHNQAGTGRLAVDIFFCISGYLITGSYLKKGSLRTFVRNRFLRIYPALWVYLGLTGFVLAFAMTRHVSLRYVWHNIFLLNGSDNTLPGLFTRLDGLDVNGSLWTLPWEVRAYVIVAALGVIGCLGNKRLILAMFLATWAYFIVTIFRYPGLETSPAITSGSRLLAFFFCGALFFLCRDRIPLRTGLFLASLLVLTLAMVLGYFFLHYSGGLFYAVAPLPLTYCVLYLAVKLPFQQINSRQDFSYGLYLYGTLVLNVLTELGWNRNWVIYVAMASGISFLLASLSWYLIERPSLRLKAH